MLLQSPSEQKVYMITICLSDGEKLLKDQYNFFLLNLINENYSPTQYVLSHTRGQNIAEAAELLVLLLKKKTVRIRHSFQTPNPNSNT